MVKQLGSMHRVIRSALSLFVAALIVGSVSYSGVRMYQQSKADSGGSIYISPGTGTLDVGDTLSVTIRENSSSDPVNSVQVSLTYDKNDLQFIGLTEGGAFPIIAASSTNQAGVMRVARGSETPRTGDQPIATITFKTLRPVTSTVSIDKGYSQLVSSDTNSDILQSVSGGSYRINGTSSGSGSGQPILYITPSTGSLSPGSTVAASVRINAYSTKVTAVEAVVSYPQDLLEYLNVSEGGGFTTQQRTKASKGLVDIIRGVPGGSEGMQGDNAVITINFKVVGGSGTAKLAFANGSAVYDASATGRNVLNLAGSTGASFGIAPVGSVAPQSPTTSSSGSIPKTTVITSPARAVSIDSKSGGSASIVNNEQGSMAALGGEVELSPILDSALFGDSSKSITKVEYYLNGKLIATAKKSPYTYKLDTQSLRNGSYTLVLKTYYSNGTTETHTEKLLVKNKVTLAYVVHHYIASMLITMLVLALLLLMIWKLVVPRLNSQGPTIASTSPEVAGGVVDLNSTNMPTRPEDTLVASDPTIVAPSSETSVAAVLDTDEPQQVPNSAVANTGPLADTSPAASQLPKPEATPEVEKTETDTRPSSYESIAQRHDYLSARPNYQQEAPAAPPAANDQVRQIASPVEPPIRPGSDQIS